MTEFYTGLAALQAGLLAIFLAALLVLMQMASQTFSLATPTLLLRRPAVILIIVGGGIVMAFALAAAVRTAYPAFEGLPGDQRTEVLLNDAWPAVGAATGVVVVLLASAVVLLQLATELQGPGLARTLARSIRSDDWVAWLQSNDPNGGDGVQRRDPLAPLFEMAVTSVQGRRYAVVDPVLGEVQAAVESWFLVPEAQQPDPSSTATRLIAHLNDFVETSLATQAVSPIEAAVIHVRTLAINAITRGDAQFSVRMMHELAHWSGRLAHAGQAGPAAAALHAIRRIATAADQCDNIAAFEQCGLALGRAAEEVAAAHKRQPDRLLQADYGDLRHDAPLPALTAAFESITSSFTQLGRGIRGELHNARFVLDGLTVACRAFLDAPQFDKHTDRVAGSLFGDMARVGLVASKQDKGEVFSMVAYEVERLASAPGLVLSDECRAALAYAAFELGINAELHSQKGAYKGLAQRLAQACAGAGLTAVREAMSSLYLRGGTMYVPDAVQRAFVRRLEETLGSRLTDRSGRSPSDPP